jgi:hypothetical protein
MLNKILKYTTYLIIFLILLIISRVFYFYNLLKLCKEIPIDECYNYLDTGDVLLFRWYTIGNFEDFNIQINSLFSHCGIVIKLNNKLYILENTRKEDYESWKRKGNVNLVDLEPRVKEYKGKVYILKNKKINCKQKENIIKNLNKYLSIKFNDNFSTLDNYFSCMFLNKSVYKKRDEMICSEFVHEIFKDIGLISQYKYSKCTTPIHVFYEDFLDKNHFYIIKK